MSLSMSYRWKMTCIPPPPPPPPSSLFVHWMWKCLGMLAQMQADPAQITLSALVSNSLCHSLQEEERERRMDFVPEESAVNTELIEVMPPCLISLVLAHILSSPVNMICHRLYHDMPMATSSVFIALLASWGDVIIKTLPAQLMLCASP